MITSMRTILITLLLALPCYGNSQSLQSQLTTWAEKYTRYDANIKPSTVVSCDIDNENERIRIVLGGGFQEQHFTPEVVERVYQDIRSFLPAGQKKYDVVVETDGRAIEDLVPNFFRKGKKDPSRLMGETYKGEP